MLRGKLYTIGKETGMYTELVSCRLDFIPHVRADSSTNDPYYRIHRAVTFKLKSI